MIRKLFCWVQCSTNKGLKCKARKDWKLHVEPVIIILLIHSTLKGKYVCKGQNFGWVRRDRLGGFLLHIFIPWLGQDINIQLMEEHTQ